MSKNFPFSKTTTLKNEIHRIVQAEENYAFEHQLEKEELSGFVNMIRKDVKSFQTAVKNFVRTPEHYEKLQMLTESVEDKLGKFKQKQMDHFDDLLEQETKLFKELDLVNSRLDTFEAPTETFQARTRTPGIGYRSNSVRNRSQPRKLQTQTFSAVKAGGSRAFDDDNDDEEELDGEKDDNQTDNQMLQAIASLEAKLDSIKNETDTIDRDLQHCGTKVGNWEADDHATFLKLRAKHKCKTKKKEFVAECLTALPYLGEMEIQDHAEKYEKHLHLEEQKKTLLQQYKGTKNELRQLTLSQIEEEEAQQRKQKAAKKPKIQAEMSKEKRDAIKAQVHTWKQNRFVDRQKSVEPAPTKSREQASAEKARIEETKRKLQEYKEKKELERVKKQEREEQKTIFQKKQFAAVDAMKLKEREERSFQKKMELLSQQRQKQFETEKKKRLFTEGSGSKYSHVSSKLNDETAAAQSKKRDKFDPRFDRSRGAETFGGNMAHHIRAVPSWRQGL